MTIHLQTGTTIDGLVQELGTYLHKVAEGFEPDPFEAWPFITPGFAVQEWLRLDLVQRFQGGLEPAFSNLDDGLWNAWKRHADPAVQAVRPLSAGHLRDLVLAALLEPPEAAGAELGPVMQYLAPHPDFESTGEGVSERARRAWQLAEQVAALFHQYESEWGFPENGDPDALSLPAWPTGVANEAHPHLSWQHYLYTTIFKDGGFRSTAYPDRLTLRQLVAASRLSAPPDPAKVRPIIVFGFDKLSPLALGILRKLGTTVPVALFLLDTGNPAGTSHPFDRWRTPYLDLLHRLGDLRPAGISAKAAPAATRSILSVMQTKLGQTSGLAPNRRGQDASLQIWACPGPQHEAELVARLLAARTDTSGAETAETAVLVTRPDEYLPLFKEAFQRHHIPFTSSGEGIALPGPYAAGLEALFDLARNGFTRSGVLRLLSNPCWQRTRRARPEMVQAWVTWADELGIFAGFTAADTCRSCHLPGMKPCDVCRESRARETGIGLTEAHTWRLALRRLRLGCLMACRDFSPADTEMPAWRGHAPFQDFATTDDETLGAFSVGVEILHAMVTRLGLPGESRSCAAWGKDLREILDTCLAARPDHPGDIVERSQAFAMIDHIADLDPLLRKGLPLELVRAGLIDACTVSASGQSRPFMGGVTLAPLASAATLPWRNVFIVGLEETQFPGGGLRSSLNLVEPLPGTSLQSGHMPVSGDDINRQTFLQALLACRDRMFLTYSCIDPAKEAELNPSSVLFELEAFLKDQVLSGNAAFRRVIVPTTPLSDRFLVSDAEPWHDPIRLVNRNEWFTSLLLAERNGSPRLPRGDRLDRLLEEARQERGIPLPQPREPAPKDLTVKVSTYHLSTFLRDPATAILQRWIYTENADEDWEEITSSPLVTGEAIERRLMKRCINEFFHLEPGDRPASSGELFQRAYDWEKLRSRLPDGLWGRIDRNRLTERFTTTVNQIRSHMGTRVQDRSLETIILGHYSTSRKIRGLPPLKTRIPAPQPPSAASRRDSPAANPAERPEWTIELSGRLPLVWREDDGLHCLLSREGKSRDETLDGGLLPNLLTYLGLLVWDEEAATSGQTPIIQSAPLVLHVIFPQGTASYRFHPDAAFARAYLKMLAGEYLAQRRFEDLRLTIVNRTELPSADTRADSYVEDLRSTLDDLSAGYSPPTFFTDLFDTIGAPPIPDDAMEKVNRRLKPIVEHLERLGNKRSKAAAEEATS